MWVEDSRKGILEDFGLRDFLLQLEKNEESIQYL